jgi:uncharacterized protein (TIGR02270 family)
VVDKVPILPGVVEQHAEEVAFLWPLRRVRLRAYDATLRELSQLDARLAANLEGLRHGGHRARELCREVYRTVGEGEVFALGVLAVEAGDPAEFTGLITGSAEDPAKMRALASVLGWVDEAIGRPWINRLAAAADSSARRVGLAGAAIRRLDLGRPFRDAIADPDPTARARALRAIGELGLTELAPRLRGALVDDDPMARTWGAWSLTRLDADPMALEVLRREVVSDGPLAAAALALTLRRLPVEEARNWSRPWRSDPTLARRALAAAAALGDPEAVPWLLECLDAPHLIRIAAEVLVAITGVDLRAERLLADPALSPTAIDADDAEELAEVTPEADLPLPDPQAVTRWWIANRHRFEDAGRLLLGGPIEPPRLWDLLRSARQPYRLAAALELAVLDPSSPLFEVRAPAPFQRSLIGSV